MADDDKTPTLEGEGGSEGDGGQQQPEGEPKTFAQEDVDRIVQERLERERKKYADYDDLKAKADQLAEIEDAEKTETQRLKEQLDEVQGESAKDKAESAKLRAAIQHGLSEDDLDLLGTGTPEEIEQRAERLAQRLAGANAPSVPASRRQGGGNEPPEETDPRKLAADMPRHW